MPGHYQVLAQVIQSPNDPRQYKAIKLPNNLDVLLISDPECDKSAASLNVDVGQLEDPEDREGLAHFLEHMLFQGTKTYSEENEFQKYLDQNGGQNNAHTDLTQTVYYFQCSNKGFLGALDRFSRFFYESLFDPKSTEREVKAVDSEHQKNIQQDLWRGYQLIRHLSKKGNPYGKFGTGSLSTLQHPTIRDDLLNFYKKYYSANLMKLVVSSDLPIEELEKAVFEYFCPIVDKSYQRQVYSEMPFDKENLGKFIQFYPIQDKNKIELYWVLEDYQKYYRNNPLSYYSHVLGHEGKNSLYSRLKREGLILSLTSGEWNQMNLFTFFLISIELTQKGLENYERVIQIIFSFIHMLKTSGPQKYVHDERKIIKNLKFATLDKQKGISYVQTLADRMLRFDIQDIIQLEYLVGDFSPEQLQNTINSLKLDNMFIKFSSKSLEDKCNLSEPIYGTKYSIENFNEKIQSFYNNPEQLDNVGYPPSNEFLPKSMQLVSEDLENLPEYPEEIYKSDTSLVFYKQDNKFKTPKGVVYWTIYTNDNGYPNNPKSSVLTELWIEVFKESISEVLYDAEIAYLTSYLDNAQNRLAFRIAGFTDSFETFLHMYIQKILEFDPAKYEDKFNDQLEQYITKYKNIPNTNPYSQIFELKDKALRTANFDPQLILEIAQTVKFEELVQFNKTWLKNVYFEWLFVGNIRKEQAIKLVKHSDEQFVQSRQVTALQKQDFAELRTVQLTSSRTLFWKRTLPENESNSAISVHYQVGTDNIFEKLKLDYLSKIIKSPFFDEMRTKQGLGYVVFSFSDESRGVYGFDFLIQSSVAGPNDLARRIEQFLVDFRQEIEGLSDEEFEQYKHSIEDDLRQKADSIKEEAKRYWSEITKHRYQFNRRQVLIENLQSITKQQVVEFYKRIFLDQPCKLELMLLSPSHSEQDAQIQNERVEKNPSLKQAVSIEWIKKVSSLFPDYDAKL